MCAITQLKMLYIMPNTNWVSNSNSYLNCSKSTPRILTWVAQDLDRSNVASTGAYGLSIESIFRCFVRKQITGLSDKKLAFQLSDTPTYRAFVRLKPGQSPTKSALQATVRRVQPEIF